MAELRTHSSPEQVAEQFAEAVAMRMAGMVHQQKGDHSQALSCFSVAREIFTHLADQAQVAWTMLREAQVLTRIDRAEEALSRLIEAQALCGQAGDGRGAALMANQRGAILRHRAQHDQALACHAQALELAQDPLTRMAILSARAGLHLARNDRASAATDVSEAQALRRAHPHPPGEADFLLAARAACAADDRASADTLAAEARALAIDLGLAHDQSDIDLMHHLRLLGSTQGR